MITRRDLILTMMTLPKWTEDIFSLNNGKTTHEPFGVQTLLHEGPTNELSTMVAGTLLLNPGMEPHPPHRHPEEEFMLITEGTGEIVVGGKTHSVAPGSLMFSDSNQEHGIRNTGTVPMRFYFFKWAK